MRMRTFAIIFVILGCASISQADILSWTCSDDGDGVITCTNSSWNEPSAGEYEMGISGTHNLWDYGHIVGEFDSDGDPNLKITNSIENDTGTTWTDYHINIYMDQSFSIVANSAFVTDPSNWNPNSVITSVTGGGHYDAHNTYHQYMGSIDYYAGTPVLSSPPEATPGTLEFGYKVNFTYSGTINYTQEMLPTPEPGTFVLLACGLLSLVFIRRRFA